VGGADGSAGDGCACGSIETAGPHTPGQTPRAGPRETAGRESETIGSESETPPLASC
jgi:hypothetical protein